MAIKIGSISISLSAETASFQSGMEKASQVALNSSKNIERSFNLMAGAITAATGAAVGSLGLLIDKTEDTVDAMHRLAQQSGVSMESFSKMAYVAKTAGMPVDQLAVILTRISRSSFEAASGSKQAAAAYKALGIDVFDAQHHFKTADQIALELAKKLDKYRYSAGKTGAETLIMGRSGAQAAEMMHLLATRYDELSATAKKLGVVFTEETAQGAQKLHESLLMIEEAGLGLSVKLLSAVSPALDEIAEKIVTFLSNADNMKRVEGIGHDIAAGIEVAGEAMEFLANHATEVKHILELLAAIRLAGMFGPMIASADAASGVMGKLGLAALNLSGSLLGIRRAGAIATDLAGMGTAAAKGVPEFFRLGQAIGYSGASSLYLGNALLSVREKLSTLLGVLSVITAGVVIFGEAMSQNKDMAEQNGHMAVTWADMWHGAMDNVKEDFHDLALIMEAIFTKNFTLLSDVKWTSLPDAALSEAKKREAAEAKNKPASTGDGRPKPDGNFPALDLASPDELKRKLNELIEKAHAAQRALALVGATPKEQQEAEITERYNLFLVDQADKLSKLSAQQRAQTEALAHAAIRTIVLTEAQTQYKTALQQASESTRNSIEEHLAMAAAVGKSAKAMQDAAIQAKVNQEFQKYGPNWRDDPEKAADAVKRANQLRDEMNAANKHADNTSLDGANRQIEAQERLNAAILRGSDARQEAAIASEQAAIHADFADRADTNADAERELQDAVKRRSDAEQEASDLERAASMDASLRYREQVKDIQDAVDAAQKYGAAIDYREVLAANKQAWIEFHDAQDKAVLATGSSLDGLKVALGQIARDTESNAQRMHDAIISAVNSMNDAIASVLTQHHERGSHFVSNAFSGAFRNIGSSLAKTGLQKAESAVLGKFGAGKPDGTSNNPWYVKIVGTHGKGGAGEDTVLGNILGTKDIGNTPSSGSTWFSSLATTAMKIIIPGFANGTDSMIAGMPAIVGEKGPELFIPPSAGAIVPNSKLGNIGNDGHVFNIDARGSHDPAQTVAVIDQYMKKAAPEIVAHSVRAVQEGRLRVPSTRR